MTEPSRQNLNLETRLYDSIDYFLIEISGKIQLTQTQRDKAIGHYEAVANVLKDSPQHTLLSQLDTKMIPFGGLGTNTASKPFRGDEFDLDVIIRFLTGAQTFGSAKRLYQEVLFALMENDVYKDRIEQKDRCIRLYYSGEFHLDLMPAVLFDPSGNSSKLIIAEKQPDGSFEFEQVDPVGLMDWYEAKCKLQKRFVNAKLDERGEFEVMPVTTEDARKFILNQAVQLLKRGRDAYFEDDEDCKKILKSVVILTVAGEVYWGQANLYQLISDLIGKLDEITFSQALMTLKNPVNSNEDFLNSLRLHDDRYEKLRAFIADFKRAWAELINPNQEFSHRTDLLKKLFGENVTRTVLNEYAERMEKINLQGKMKMNASGIIGVSTANVAAKVPRHQFFGDK
jgi:hypothetical protein